MCWKKEHNSTLWDINSRYLSSMSSLHGRKQKVFTMLFKEGESLCVKENPPEYTDKPEFSATREYEGDVTRMQPRLLNTSSHWQNHNAWPRPQCDGK